MDKDLDNIMKGLGKMLSSDKPDEIFEQMFAKQIADAEKGPQMPDTIVLEYSDGTKETLTQKKQ